MGMVQAEGNVEGAAEARAAQKRRSRELHGEILASYKLRSVGGRASSLQAAWADPHRAMPGGTGGEPSLTPTAFALICLCACATPTSVLRTDCRGRRRADCCAPKLLQAAALQGLTPVSMAEFWYMGLLTPLPSHASHRTSAPRPLATLARCGIYAKYSFTQPRQLESESRQWRRALLLVVRASGRCARGACGIDT